jgi:hypothetical protein
MGALRAFPPAARTVLLVGATSLFMVLVAWATLIGPDEVFTGPGRTERTFTPTAQTCTPLETATTGSASVPPDGTPSTPTCGEPDTSLLDAPDSPPIDDPPLWLRILVWTFVIAVLGTIVALAVFLALLARDQMRGRRVRSGKREGVEFATLDEPARLAEAITDDAVAQDGLLREGDPRNAIVAAWLRFEVQGDAAGVGRRSWETSSEYAIRILDLVSADSGAVHRLSGLYLEARFSEHPITEDHRTEALDALAGIRRSLGART